VADDRDDGAPVLVLRAERLRAARRVLVARQVVVSAAAGEVVAVEGANGSGKSTLLAAAAGVLSTGQNGRRPASVGYAPERADVLPRLALRRWLTGLARTAGLSREEAAGQTEELLTRIGLAGAGHRPLRELSRGNVQRALVAQALVGPPQLLVLDEPSGGLDHDGLGRLTAEIRRAAGRSSVVLVARHPTAPLPLPAGPSWRIADGAVEVDARVADTIALVEIETGDGEVRRINEPELPGMLRAALDQGLAVRRVQLVEYAAEPVAMAAGGSNALVGGAGAVAAGIRHAPAAAPRAGGLRRIGHGAAHRARLLTASQWFAAPALLYLIVLGILYASQVGPLLPAAAFTAAVLVPVMSWITVLAHLSDGRLMARVFAAHIGGRARAHLAASLATAPFAVVATAVAVAWPAVSQNHLHHGFPGLLLDMVVLHLAAALLGVGVGTLLVPPLVDRAGWRICLAAGLFLILILVPVSPMRPLLLLATHPAMTSVAGPAALLAATGAVLIAVTAALSSRLS
jgi:ABC-2 type transport system ATP-binding protein